MASQAEADSFSINVLGAPPALFLSVGASSSRPAPGMSPDMQGSSEPGSSSPEPVQDKGASPEKTAAPDSHVVQILKLAATKVGGAAGTKLLELATPSSVATMMAFIGLFVAAQWTPAGWVADGILVVTMVASAALIGRELSGIIDDVRAFVRLASDPKGDVEDAADHLARAVAAVGVDVIVAILMHKAASSAKPYLKPPAGFVDLVTPGGQIVRVSADALARKEPPGMMQEPASRSGAVSGIPAPPESISPKAVEETPADPKGFEDAIAKGDIETAAKKLGCLDTEEQISNLAKLKPDELAKIHAAQVKEFGRDSPQSRMSDPTHRADVEWDPARGGPRPPERDTALRVEQKVGVKLDRYNPQDGKKGDWIDPSGKVYDGCSPPATEFFEKDFKKGRYAESLKKHLDNPNLDFVVVDVTNLGLSSEQLTAVTNVIDKIAGAKISKILRIP